jgi:glycosyltransferase involved in cell wall biosynthesis
MADLARSFGARQVEMVGTPIPRRFLIEPLKPMSGQIGRVLFAGRLAPEKNVESIIDAARDLPATRFVLVGDGPLRETVADAARELDNLSWLGWQPRERMLNIIDGTDVLILPSSVESFGTIALEAMARGRMTLVSAACGILGWPDLARGLFAMERGETVGSAIRRMTAIDPALRRSRALAGRRAAQNLAASNTRHWLDLIGPS